MPSSASAPAVPSWLLRLLHLLVPLILIQRLHWPSFQSLPRIQPCLYPAAPGEEVVYGFRVLSPPESSTRWAVEVGKIPDDGLKGRVAESYMGLTDNWLYLRVSDGEETHLVLASLFLANLISRAEAEAILSKGPGQNLSLSSTLHRLPSFAALGAAYYGGAHVGARKLLGPRASEGVIAPALVGSASAAGVALFSSRSTAFSGQLPPPGETRNIATLMLSSDLVAMSEGEDPFVVLMLADMEEQRACDLAKAEPLPAHACHELPAYTADLSSAFSAASASLLSASRLEQFEEAVMRIAGGRV
ncbi:hypothetical protein JCM10213_000524 [Rhodosporidiobolus nylandii]